MKPYLKRGDKDLSLVDLSSAGWTSRPMRIAWSRWDRHYVSETLVGKSDTRWAEMVRICAGHKVASVFVAQSLPCGIRQNTCNTHHAESVLWQITKSAGTTRPCISYCQPNLPENATVPRNSTITGMSRPWRQPASSNYTHSRSLHENYELSARDTTDLHFSVCGVRGRSRRHSGK